VRGRRARTPRAPVEARELVAGCQRGSCSGAPTPSHV
jgi:hypothetical protein